MAELIEVVIDSLRVSLTNQQRIVLLKAVNADRFLPIWIGPFEAEAITIALQEIEVARPQTHDLLKTILDLLNAHLQRVVISNLKDDIFYATIIAEAANKELEIDARPSDAIALALRAHVPILVTKEILEEAGIEPVEEEEEIQAATGEESSGESKKTRRSLKYDERLSIFEEYLKKRDKDKSAKPDEGADKPAPDKGK